MKTLDEIRIAVNPAVSADRLFSFYEKNDISEKGFGKETAARVLDHSSPIVGAFDGDRLRPRHLRRHPSARPGRGARRLIDPSLPDRRHQPVGQVGVDIVPVGRQRAGREMAAGRMPARHDRQAVAPPQRRRWFTS